MGTDKRVLRAEWYADVNTRLVYLHVMLLADTATACVSLASVARGCGLSVREVRTAFARLTKGGYIATSSTDRQRTTIRIVKSDTKSDTENDTENDKGLEQIKRELQEYATQKTTQKTTQTDPPPPAEERAVFGAVRVYPLAVVVDMLKNDTAYIERVQMITSEGRDYILQGLEVWKAECMAKEGENATKSLEDARKHFINYFRIWKKEDEKRYMTRDGRVSTLHFKMERPNARLKVEDYDPNPGASMLHFDGERKNTLKVN